MKNASRREFLGGIGRTMTSAAVGLAIAQRAGWGERLGFTWPTGLARERLRFGTLDPLVDWLQETPAERLMPLLVEKLHTTPLGDVVAAGALANARAHGGTNYNGYHALMAMVPSYEMAAQMPAPYGALPVLKVLHRNARFLQDTGHCSSDALEPLGSPAAGSADELVASVRARDLARAEASLAASLARSHGKDLDTYEELQRVVRDDMNVHRVVLAWRAHDLQRLTGEEHALTLLRQCVRFCVDEDGHRASRGQPENEIRALLPELVKDRELDRRERGTRKADDAWIERLADTVFSAERRAAAAAAADALAQGFDPEDVGAALTVAATRLLLHDPGLASEQPGKPAGSVHGASVGVHASDAANAWRHIARVGSARNTFASLIAGAYHTAGQSGQVGALPHDHEAEPCTEDALPALLAEIEGRIQSRDQKGACQAARRYVALGHPSADLFALLLRFAVSEDGALHAEKYFRTVQEEHSTARPAHAGLLLVALTRVMASHFGFPAPGYEEAHAVLAG